MFPGSSGMVGMRRLRCGHGRKRRRGQPIGREPGGQGGGGGGVTPGAPLGPSKDPRGAPASYHGAPTEPHTTPRTCKTLFCPPSPPQWTPKSLLMTPQTHSREQTSHPESRSVYPQIPDSQTQIPLSAPKSSYKPTEPPHRLSDSSMDPSAPPPHTFRPP